MKKITVFLLLLVLLTIFLFFSFKNKNQKLTRENKNSVKVQQKNQQNGGKIWLEIKEKSRIGQKSTLVIFADSKGELITGFDLILNYDKNFFKIDKVVSLINEYQIFEIVKEEFIKITGIKKIENKTLTIFKDTPLVEIDLIPLRQGETNITFDYNPKKTNDSNLINNKSQDILNEVRNIAVEIE